MNMVNNRSSISREFWTKEALTDSPSAEGLRSTTMVYYDYRALPGKRTGDYRTEMTPSSVLSPPSLTGSRAAASSSA